MTIHMKREIDKLKARMLSLSGIVEERLRLAMKSFRDRDAKLAAEVVDGDIEIDRLEVDIEEECLKILALYQPVAIDLRFIVTVLKINNDLERIGDLAANIAERSIFIEGREELNIRFNLHDMAEKARAMLRNSLNSLVNMDSTMAHKVCIADDEVDDINRDMHKRAKEMIKFEHEDVDFLIQILSVSRHIERIADLATNIAEDVIYMVEGKIVRHKVKDLEFPSKSKS